VLPQTTGCWTPDVSLDGHTVVFARKEPHSPVDSTIFLMTLGEKEPRPITRGSHPRFSRDGRWIVFQREMQSGNTDIWIMHADGGGKRQITHTDDAEEYPALSPDGRFVVYASARGDALKSRLTWRACRSVGGESPTRAGQPSIIAPPNAAARSPIPTGFSARYVRGSHSEEPVMRVGATPDQGYRRVLLPSGARARRRSRIRLGGARARAAASRTSSTKPSAR
jgi:hypothetical protein